MAYYQVMVLAIALTVFALWKPNVLLAIVASAGWWAMLAYHNANPPTNITNGSTIDTFMTLAYIGVALAIPLIIVSLHRSRANGGNFMAGGFSGGEGEVRSRTRQPQSILTEMNANEYRTHIRSRMRRKR